MKKAMTFSIICSVLILFVASVFAQPQRMMMRYDRLIKRSPARILRLLKAKQKELKITDSQIAKIQNLINSSEEKMIKMRSEAELQRLELKKLLQIKENLDYEKIRLALSKASKTRQNIFIERIKTRKEIENILTLEQREALKAMRQDWRKNRGQFLRRRGFFQRGNRVQRFHLLRDKKNK